MLSETFFNPIEAEQLQSVYTKFKRVSYMVLLFGIPLEFLIAYAGSRRYHLLFVPLLIITIGILLTLFYFAFVKRMNSFKQDLQEQRKLVGSVEVLSKSEKDKQFIVNLNSDDLKQVNLQKPLFERINSGDSLSIEFSKYGKYIFKLSKENEVLISR